MEPNVLALQIQPDEGISLKFGSKVPGPTVQIRSVNMDFRYGTYFGVEPPDAYERLLLDCMLGDSTLFTRRDEVEVAWSLISAIHEGWTMVAPPQFPNYDAGAWGPGASARDDGARWPDLAAVADTVGGGRWRRTKPTRTPVRAGERAAPGRCPRHRGRARAVVGDGSGRPLDDAGVRPQSDRLRRVVRRCFRGATGRRDGGRARTPPARSSCTQSDGEETRLRAWISAQCEFPGASDHAGSEQVMLEASGDGVRQLPGTVIPLLIPEVPVVLWWPGDGLFNHPIFPSMMDASDQLVVDSSAFSDSLTLLGRLHSLATEEYPGVALRDLVWARLTPWRELTAQFFDAPTTRPYLEGIHRVHVTYAHPTPGPYQPRAGALVCELAGLAARLGDDPQSPPFRAGDDADRAQRRVADHLGVFGAECAGPAARLPAGDDDQRRVGRAAARPSRSARADDREHITVTTDIHGQTTQERIVPMHESHGRGDAGGGSQRGAT